MSLEELKTAVDEMKTAVAALQKANDERLKAIETKGSVPADLTAKIDKINDAVSATEAKSVKLHEELTAIKTAINRPGGPNGGSGVQRKSMDGKRFLSENEIKYESCFDAYARRGVHTATHELTTKAFEDAGFKAVGQLVTDIDPAGGYLIAPDLSGRLVEKIWETSPLRQLASATSISTSALEGPYDDDEPVVTRTSEKVTPSVTNAPNVPSSWRIQVHDSYAMPKASQNMLDDTAFALESWLMRKVQSRFSRQENYDFILGAGVDRPRGIMSYGNGTTRGTVAQVNTGASGGLTADFVVGLPYELTAHYRQNSVWITNRAGVKAARLLVDSDKRYLWQNGFGDIVNGQPATLNGYRIVEMEDMAAWTSASLSIAFGDFRSAYQIVDRQGFRLVRDNLTSKPWVLFWVTKRTGGDVIDFNAYKIGVASI